MSKLSEIEFSEDELELSEDKKTVIRGYYYSITHITIPNSVTKIGRHAFENCSALQSIEIPNSVTEIGDSAFIGCSSLKNIEIPNSVTRIGNYAFDGCSMDVHH